MLSHTEQSILHYKPIKAVMSPHAIRSIYFAYFHVHLRHSCPWK